MKLLFCTDCGDVRKINIGETFCLCKKTAARYLDNLYVEWNGNGRLIGFKNSEFRSVVENNNNENFTAFILPKECPTVNPKNFKKRDFCVCCGSNIPPRYGEHQCIYCETTQ